MEGFRLDSFGSMTDTDIDERVSVHPTHFRHHPQPFPSGFTPNSSCSSFSAILASRRELGSQLLLEEEKKCAITVPQWHI
jgi:hypothetical protein